MQPLVSQPWCSTLVSSRRRWPSIGGVAFACALLVRPVAVGLLPALLLLAWSAWRRKGWLPALLLARVSPSSSRRPWWSPTACTGAITRRKRSADSPFRQDGAAHSPRRARGCAIGPLGTA